MATYLTVWSERTLDMDGAPEYTDYYQAFDSADAAVARYHEVRALPECYTAHVCAPILSTDYEVSK